MLHLLSEPLTWTLILINTIVFIIVYQCIIKNWNYFTKNNVKFIRGLPFIGVHYRFVFGRESFYDSFLRLSKQMPNERFYGIYDLCGKPTYLIHDPELVKQVTIRDFDHFVNHQFDIHEESDKLFGRSLFIMRDQKWKDMRATISPAFTGSKMRLMFSLVADVSQRFCQHLKENELKSSGTLECDVTDIFARFSNDAIASCIFGIDINSLKDRNNDFYRISTSMANFDGLTGLIFFAYASIPKVMNFFKVKFFKDSDISYIRTLVNETVRYREENNIVRNDMINMLIEAKRGTLTADDEDNGGLASLGVMGKKLEKWDEDDLVAQCIGMFLGGFTNVALTISFCAHALAVNADVQEKLYNEISEVEKSLNGKPLTYEQLQKMKYLDMFIDEVLRIWPQAPGSDREVSKPYIIENYDGNKVQLNVGDGIFVPSLGIQMDEKYYPNPMKFDPERFTEEKKRELTAGALYLPFGIGPRNCIAARLAIMEFKAFTYYLVANMRLEKCSKTDDPLILKRNTGSVKAQNGYWMKITTRN